MKLHKGLARGIPHKCLPLDFMGFYALAGLEPDRRLKAAVKQYMIADINKRRDYIRSITMSGGGQSLSLSLSRGVLWGCRVLFTSFWPHKRLRLREAAWKCAADLSLTDAMPAPGGVPLNCKGGRMRLLGV